MRIRRRLVLYAVGVATVGMLVFGILLSMLAAGGVATEQDEVLGGLADETARAVEATGPDAVAEREPLVPVDLATSTEPFQVVLDEAGTVTYTTGLLDGAPPDIPAAVIVDALELGTASATIRPAEEVELRIHAARWEAAGESGVAVAGQSTQFLREQLSGLNFFLVFSGVVTIVVVAIVSRSVIGRALRPLRELAVTADEIGRTGDLHRRLPAVRTRDEVGSLTSSFNAMLDSLEQAQARLAAALAAQQRFVADASHELRTPVTTVRGNAEFLLEHPDAEAADRDEALQDIEAEAERMSRLVDGLLLLARVDAGQPLESRPVDLAVLADEVGRRARRPDRTIAVVNDGPAVVEGDTDALTRLLWILVDNAVHHGAGDVEVTVAGTGDPVRLSVADRGRGFAEADLERVFERFHRGDAARTGEGTGLGLAIARAIVEAHGGTIRAANRPDGGAVVTAELPPMALGSPVSA